MDGINVGIWIVADILLGAVHVLLFIGRLLSIKPLPRTTRFGQFLVFLGTGVIFAYAVTLLATNMGALCQSWWNFAATEDQRELCAILSLFGLPLLVISAMLFTLCSSFHPTSATASTRINDRFALWGSATILTLSVVVAFSAFWLSSDIVATVLTR